MCEFKPGDEVVCVEAEYIDKRPTLLVKGQTYTVREVLPLFLAKSGLGTYGSFGVRLVEVDAPYGWRSAYDSRRFRKVMRKNDRLKIEAFMTMPGGFEEPRRVVEPAKEKAS